ncbi:MAG: rRNA pseudouridine synthase [Lachnospiraceae bacterium]|jgi:16S rRNA pseudouridine516 synthase|nr:rRNA pseudouridine synthase [Lachnospiraceae bacterium]
MLRLDKFLCDVKVGSRSQVKEYLKKGMVKVNGEVVKRPEFKVDEKKDGISFQGKEILYKRYVYYMLNKPKGVVSATRDACRTVTDLLKDTGYDDLFPVGRLDKDTEGLLLMTNDGNLAHNLLSPKKHVEKKYYVELERTLGEEDRKALETGVDIGEERLTFPAKVEQITETSIFLIITEGKYHQVKRMMQAVENEVVYLKRVAMGGIFLDENLPQGAYRELTEDEMGIIVSYGRPE